MVRQRSAKPLFSSSNLDAASSFFILLSGSNSVVECNLAKVALSLFVFVAGSIWMSFVLVPQGVIGRTTYFHVTTESRTMVTF